MNALWLLTKKNLTLLLRAKASALIVVFGPLLVMLILGISYNTSGPYGLTLGVNAPESSGEVQQFLDGLQQEGFRVVKYDESVEKCVEDLKSSIVHACLQVPSSFQVEGNEQKEVAFYLDPSRMHLVWMVQDTLNKKFQVQLQQVSQQLSQEILEKLHTTKNTLAERKGLLSLAQERSAQASQAAQAVQNSLTGLDVAVTGDSYDLSLVQTVTERAALAKSKVSGALSSFREQNLSGTSGEAVEGDLQSAAAALQELSSILEGEGTITLTSVFTSMQSDLQTTRAKLTSAATAIQSSTPQLGITTSSLQETTGALESALQTVNDIQANLERQTVTDPETVTAPLKARIETVTSPRTYLNYLFPTLLMVVIMFTSLLLGTTLVMMEKNSPAFLRNYFLPLKKATFVLSTYLTTLIVIFAQIVVILGISLFFVHDLLPAMPALFGVLFLSSSVFTFLGMGLGYLFVSEETAVLASISTGSLLLFVSGVVLPVESISPALREVMQYNPFVLGEKVLRESVIFQTPLAAVGGDLLLLVSYALILLFSILLAEALLHQHLAHRFLQRHHLLHRQKDKKREE